MSLSKVGSKLFSPRSKKSLNGGTEIKVEAAPPSAESGGATTAELVVPEGAKPNQRIAFTHEGVRYTFILPDGAEAGDRVEFEMVKPADTPPPQTASDVTEDLDEMDVHVELPESAKAGDKISVTASDGQKYVFTVPEGVEPGLPVELSVPKKVAAKLPEDLAITVPADAVAGITQLLVTTPQGKTFSIVVPEGAEEGDVIYVSSGLEGVR